MAACSKRPWPLMPQPSDSCLVKPCLSIGFILNAYLPLCWQQNGPLAKLSVTKGQLSSNESCGGMFKETLATDATVFGFMPCHTLFVKWFHPQRVSTLVLAAERPSSEAVRHKRAAELQRVLWRHIQRDPGH